jgi:hypothetical protein
MKGMKRFACGFYLTHRLNFWLQGEKRKTGKYFREIYNSTKQKDWLDLYLSTCPHIFSFWPKRSHSAQPSHWLKTYIQHCIDNLMGGKYPWRWQYWVVAAKKCYYIFWAFTSHGRQTCKTIPCFATCSTFDNKTIFTSSILSSRKTTTRQLFFKIPTQN